MNEMEMELNLKDLLYRVLKKWRSIILGAVIVALLLGAVRFASGMRLYLDKEALQEAQNAYEITLSDYEATGERLRTTISNLRSDLEHQQWYNDRSVLMQIDPTEKWEGSFTIYVDAKYQIDPALSYQNTDRTYRLVSAYAGFLQSGEVYLSLLDALDYVDELIMLREIYSVSSDVNSASVTVKVTGRSQEDVLQIRDAVKDLLDKEHTALVKTIGDHDYGILQESVYSVTDLNLDTMQKENILKISDYTNQIGTTQQELEEWSQEAEPRPEYGLEYTIKQTIKMMILGGVGGVFLMLVVYAAVYICSNTVKVDEDFQIFGLPVLGHIRRESEKKALWKIDRWLDRLFLGGEKSSLEESCRLAGVNLAAVLKEKSLSEGVLVGDVDADFARKATELMNTEESGRFVYAGNVLSDAAAAKALAEASEVILLAETGKSSVSHVTQEGTLLRAWGKTILGVLVVE